MSTVTTVRTMDRLGKKGTPIVKHRDPASKLKAKGALRTRPFLDKRKRSGRKDKHKGDHNEPR